MKETGVVFFHIRPLGYYIALDKNDPKHTVVDDLLKEYWSRQGTTFAFEKRNDGNWYGANAYCGKNDQFNRRIGRMVAQGKLQCKRKNLAVCFGREEPSFDDCVVLRDLLEHDSHYERLERFYTDASIVAEIMQAYSGANSIWDRSFRTNRLIDKGMTVHA